MRAGCDGRAYKDPLFSPQIKHRQKAFRAEIHIAFCKTVGRRDAALEPTGMYLRRVLPKAIYISAMV
ncbi:MAG: hypothetical protein BMS9Abin26_0407 [Gammaproteobacteria bacterium]|nr:MAG: hypothetical protein BMS9Abin26_0407 [Gammaproteobacteria bacterium]